MKNSTLESEQLRQRADYTHKYNSKTGRHGWLRLTPAYSVKVVEQLIEKHLTPQRIFDPFCGTGTTALSAAYHGHESVTTDINPFLLWLAGAKTKRYSSEDITKTRKACKAALELVAQKTKLMPRSMINTQGNGVTDEFFDYVLPIAGGVSEIRALKASNVSKSLPEYIRT